VETELVIGPIEVRPSARLRGFKDGTPTQAHVNYTALLDACVLYPAPLRDLLLSIAVTDLFRARWTDQIHEEWIAALVKEGRDRSRLERTRKVMDTAVPDCLVKGYEGIIDSLVLPDKKDRHVLAAAIVGGADVIVTFNLSDFPAKALEPYDIEAQHPDDFLICQLDLSEELVLEAVRAQRARLKKPAYSVEEFLLTLSKQSLPQTVERLKKARHQI
jgi:hypothetical protein